MPPQMIDPTGVLRRLRQLVHDAGGSVPEAAKLLRVKRVTLWRWLNKPLGRKTLKDLAESTSDKVLAEAAQKALGLKPVPSFDYGHIAAQLTLAGPPASMLLDHLAQELPEEAKEHAAVHDLVCAFSDIWQYNMLNQMARSGLKYAPTHPLGQLNVADYEECLHPDIRPAVPNVVGLGGARMVSSRRGPVIRPDHYEEDVKRFENYLAARIDMAKALMEFARHRPSHVLYDVLYENLVRGSVRERSADEPQLSEGECQRIAALSGVDTYAFLQSVMHAADTVRKGANKDRRLEQRPLYAIASKMFEICHMAHTTIGQMVEDYMQHFREDEEVFDRMVGVCDAVHRKLSSDTASVYMFNAENQMSVVANAHGSVIDPANGRPSIVSRPGDKRKAPKRAMARGPQGKKGPRSRG